MRSLVVMCTLVLVAAVALLIEVARAGVLPAVQVRDPVWSPYGTQLAYVRAEDGSGEIWVVGFDRRHRRRITPPQPSTYGLSWSPDGRSLAYASDGDIWRVDLSTGLRTRLTSDRGLGAFQPDWSPDGKTIAYTVFEGCFRCTNVYGVAADGGTPGLLVRGARRPQWSPDGTQLLTSSPVQVVDLRTGAATQVPGASFPSWGFGRGDPFVYAAPDGIRYGPHLVWRRTGLIAYPAANLQGARFAFVAGRSVVIVQATRRVATLRADSANDAPRWSFRGQLAYVADGPCGARSEIDVARADGAQVHALARAC